MSQTALGPAVTLDDIADPAALAQKMADQGHKVNLFINSFESIDAIRLEKALRLEWGFRRARLDVDVDTKTLTLEWVYPRKQEPTGSTLPPLTGSFDLCFIPCTDAMKKVVQPAGDGKGLVSNGNLWIDDRSNVAAMDVDTNDMRSMLVLAIAEELGEERCSLLQSPGNPQWFEEMAKALEAYGGPPLVFTDKLSTRTRKRDERMRLFVVAPQALDLARVEALVVTGGLISTRLSFDSVTHTLACAWEAPADYVTYPGAPTGGLPNLSGMFSMPFVRCTGAMQSVMQRDNDSALLFHSENLWMDEAPDVYTLPAAEGTVQMAVCVAISELLPDESALIKLCVDPAFYEELAQKYEALDQVTDEPGFNPFRMWMLWAIWAVVALTMIGFVAGIF